MSFIRPPAVANMFYPGNPRSLSHQLEAMLNDSATRAEAMGPVPKAIIAPHAGYVYSGPVAATVYNRLRPARATIKRVILLGPCHRVPVRGVALSGAEAFDTPLGRVPLDVGAIAGLTDLPNVEIRDDAHRDEHSLEVHLPFLQTVVEDFSLVPLVVGAAEPNLLAEVLERLWGGPETLIVVSSDLSHYLNYEAARRMDAMACHAIENFDGGALGDDMACGRFPVRGLLLAARRHGLKVQRVDVRNSGDTAGSRDRVVGYGAWAFLEAGAADEEDFADETKALLEEHGEGLLILAARSILHGLAKGAPLPVDPARADAKLAQPGACFVTLERFGRLRGCVGSARAHRPLISDVVTNAYSAAFGDTRFDRLTREELAGLKLSISVLSPYQPMSVSSRAQLIERLRPGRDGLILSDGANRALFLPQVWKQLPEPERFVGQLLRKAGLEEDYWSPNMRVERFVTESYGCDRLADPASLWNLAGEA